MRLQSFAWIITWFLQTLHRERERIPIKWKSLIKYISQENMMIDNDDQSTWIMCLWMNARIIYYKSAIHIVFLIIPFSEEQKYFQSMFNYRMIFARTNKGIDNFHFHTQIILVSANYHTILLQTLTTCMQTQCCLHIYIRKCRRTYWLIG